MYGRRSRTLGCVCFGELKGATQANISSVDSSTGCKAVFSSGVWNVNKQKHGFMQFSKTENMDKIIFQFAEIEYSRMQTRSFRDY